MAATKTVPQLLQSHKSVVSRTGVLTLSGYGIHAQVDRGHLCLEDGIASDRRFFRLPRVGHGLKRLVIIGADGIISLAALRWLADQDVAVSVLERNGKVLFVTGPVYPSDARLRRSQALAIQSGVALEIARELVGQKLDAQAQLVREKLLDDATARTIAEFRKELATADSSESIRLLESQAARAYWSRFANLTVNFPKSDLPRVPRHWSVFGSRISVLTGSPRLATNPANAILNYLYAVSESMTRSSIASLGMDPGMGVLHADASVRDSLACDLQEPIRVKIDAYVLDWILHETFRRDWFFEDRNGNCRLMGTFAIRLSETALIWARAVAPVAEWVARKFAANISKPSRYAGPPTRLTQTRKRIAKGVVYHPPVDKFPAPEKVCRGCGKSVARGSQNCAECALAVSRANLRQVAQEGRIAAQTSEAQARRSATKHRHDAARSAWDPSTLPTWLNEEVYRGQVLPRLPKMSVPIIAAAIGVSLPYATEIRSGKRRPHRRHWHALAQLTRL